MDNLFRRRPEPEVTPTFFTKKNTSRVSGRRKRLVSRSDRARPIALVVFAAIAIFILFGFLIGHFLGKASSTAIGSADIVNQDNFLQKWKPSTTRRVNENWDLSAAEKRLKATVFAKESGRRTINNNNDEQTSWVRTAKAQKAAKVNSQSPYRRKFDKSELGYDVENCPANPSLSYPKAWKATEVLTNWNPNDVTTVPPAHRDVYHGLCIFDYQTQYGIAKEYRDAEKPFIMRNDPNVMAASKRWNDPNYLLEKLPDEKVYTERSPVNHFMFYNAKHKNRVNSWTQPSNDIIEMTYREWLERAYEREAIVLNSPEISVLVEELRGQRMSKEKHGETGNIVGDDDEIEEDNDTEEEKRLKWYYLRINGWLEHAEEGTDKFVFDELNFFDPRKKDSNFYMIDKDKQRGINCRFGMRGIVAENHFDLSRNTIALLGGERRYIIAHPSQCPNMALYPHEHPSGRHSSFSWSNPTEWDIHPAFKEALVSEVVMHAGDVLYLPTAWFHYIVNLSKNIQCNIRSGIGGESMKFINECGFTPKGYHKQ